MTMNDEKYIGIEAENFSELLKKINENPGYTLHYCIINQNCYLAIMVKEERSIDIRALESSVLKIKKEPGYKPIVRKRILTGDTFEDPETENTYIYKGKTLREETAIHYLTDTFNDEDVRVSENSTLFKNLNKKFAFM